MHVDERLPAWAAQLDAAYEVVWATAGRLTSSNASSGRSGCRRGRCSPGRWARRFSRRAGGRGRGRFKTQAIAEHLHASPRPFAWAATGPQRPAAPRPVRDLGLEHLLIRPRSTDRATAQHIDQLLRFANQLTGSASAGKRRASTAGEERGR